MNILFTYGPPFSRDQVGTFVDAWHSVSPDDHFDVIPFDATEKTLRHFWDKDYELHSLNGDDPYEAGRALRIIVDDMSDRRADHARCAVMIHGHGYPDGGYAFLRGLVHASDSSDSPGQKSISSSKQEGKIDYDDLLTAAEQLLRPIDITIYAEQHHVLLGLDGALTQWHQGQRDEFGHVIRPATDDQQAYQEVRIVSDRMRQAQAFGQRPRKDSVTTKDQQSNTKLSSGKAQAHDRDQLAAKDVLSAEQASSPASKNIAVNSPSKNREIPLNLVAATPVQPGFIPGGAVAGGGGEVLVRLGKRLRLCADAIDEYAQLQSRLAKVDMIITTADTVQSWTIDDLLSARIVPVNQGFGKPLLILAWSSEIGRREMGDNGIDSVCTIPRATTKKMTSSEQLSDAGIRCARTWSHMR